jgi:hypothetical protein
MYQGTLIMHGFENDRTDGTTLPFTENAPFAVPRIGHCNTVAWHAHESLTLPTYYNNNTATATHSAYNYFSIPSYGGQVATIHTSQSAMVAKSCGAPTRTYGQPLTGKGTIHTTGATSTSRAATDPRGFTMVKYAMHGSNPGGSLGYGHPYIFEVDYADLRNARGVFGAGMGLGRFGSVYLTGGSAGAKMLATPGAHAFGGTMRLLGTTYSFEGFYYDGVADTNVAKYTWLLQYMGTAAIVNTGNTGFQSPGITTALNYYIGWQYGSTYSSAVSVFGMSWTTGTVTVSATGGPNATVMARAGFDNRDAHGYGDIQMVAPQITRWIYGSTSYPTGSVAIFQLKVAPEPHEWMMLGAGLSMLGLLYRANRRSR